PALRPARYRPSRVDDGPTGRLLRRQRDAAPPAGAPRLRRAVPERRQTRGPPDRAGRVDQGFMDTAHDVALQRPWLRPRMVDPRAPWLRRVLRVGLRRTVRVHRARARAHR